MSETPVTVPLPWMPVLRQDAVSSRQAATVVSIIVELSHFLMHCNENPIYVFSENELRGLSPNFHIHVSVSDLYIPRIGPHIFPPQDRQTDRGNI